LRRTHNIFSSLKDETGNKYDEKDKKVMFVDENTLKYQNVIKKMDGKKAGEVGSGDEEGSEEDQGFKEQSTVITTNIKHVGKGIVVQSYDISDDDDDDDDDEDDNVERDSNVTENKVMLTYNETFQNPNKKIVYTDDNNIDVDDI
jgi:hypothetical protein